MTFHIREGPGFEEEIVESITKSSINDAAFGHLVGHVLSCINEDMDGTAREATHHDARVLERALGFCE